MSITTYGSSGPGRGKVGQMSLFDQKLEAATDREKQKFIHFQVLLSNLSWWSVQNQVSDFWRNLGCAPYAQSWVFFQNFQNTAFLFLYYSAHKKATAMVYICGDRGYPAVRFDYKMFSDRYLVTEK